ncbi:hypothetical protein BPIT_25710 [Candidatus Brocadia pituitae]|nr:hypothetical protein BPIT_25710 [Candidatus Brocadia pituitae]
MIYLSVPRKVSFEVIILIPMCSLFFNVDPVHRRKKGVGNSVVQNLWNAGKDRGGNEQPSA